MSTSQASADVIGQLQENFIDNCCSVASSALIFYEHAVTLSQETRFMWRSRRSFVTVLYFVNRWTTWALGIATLLNIVPWDTRIACLITSLLTSVIQITLFAAWASFSALRVFAIGGRDWSLTLTTLGLGLVPCVTNIFGIIRASYFVVLDQPFGWVCVNQSEISDAANFRSEPCNPRPYLPSQDSLASVLIATRTCAIASDLMVLIITWRSTWRIKRAAAEANIRASLATLLLRDGTIYFMLFLALNVIHMTLFLVGVFEYVTIFMAPLASILISRFIMNLRQIHSTKEVMGGARPSFVRTLSINGQPWIQESHLTSMKFASSILGNVGAPLSHGSGSLPSTTNGGDSMLSSGGFTLGYGTPPSKRGDEAESDTPEMFWVSDDPLGVGVIPLPEVIPLQNVG